MTKTVDFAIGKKLPLLDQVTGYKRSSRDKFLQHLIARRLIETPTRGEVTASETLFA